MVHGAMNPVDPLGEYYSNIRMPSPHVGNYRYRHVFFLVPFLYSFYLTNAWMLKETEKWCVWRLLVLEYSPSEAESEYAENLDLDIGLDKGLDVVFNTNSLASWSIKQSFD